MKERTKLLLLIGTFVAAYYVPWSHPLIRQSGLEAFMMLQEYAREHVLTCLIPAFFIAGAIAVFVSQASVLKYFGAQASKILSYSVASISGTILAVCSCTVLPLFAGIYTQIRMGKHMTGIIGLKSALAEIGRCGMMDSPALLINNEVKAVGSVPSKTKIKAWIEQAANQMKS